VKEARRVHHTVRYKILVFIINYSSALGEPLGSRCVRVQKTLMQGREAERLSGYKGVSRPYVSSVC
jgi:hypothetical protein